MSPFWNRHPRGELSAYVDDQLPAGRREVLDRHLLACDACRAELEQLRVVRDALSELPEVTPTRSFALSPEQVAGAQPTAPREPYVGMPLAQGLRIAAAGLGVALVAVVLVDAGGVADDDGSAPDARIAAELQSADDADLDYPTANLEQSSAAPADESAAAGADAFGGDAAADGSGGEEDRSSDDDSGDQGTPSGGVSSAQTPDAGLAPTPVNGYLIPGSEPTLSPDIAAAPPGDDADSREATGGPIMDSNADGDEAGDDDPAARESLDDDSSGDGLGTLTVVEIALAIALGAAVVGGFVLPRLQKRE